MTCPLLLLPLPLPLPLLLLLLPPLLCAPAALHSAAALTHMNLMRTLLAQCP
jgi:hypothetical protein